MKVGDYVRTKYGISKIISNPNENKFNIDIFKKDGITLRCIRQRDIIKSSPNIIDLIELRDIVELYEESWYDNGIEKEETGYYEVLAYTTDRKEIGVRNKDGEIDWYPSENLRGIITYEKIESMKYKVGEKENE